MRATDPFEMATGETEGTFLGLGGALGGPVTAYIYDWNVLPIGQQLWLKELESYTKFPPLQAPESYNLTQIVDEVQKTRTDSAGVRGLDLSPDIWTAVQYPRAPFSR